MPTQFDADKQEQRPAASPSIAAKGFMRTGAEHMFSARHKVVERSAAGQFYARGGVGASVLPIFRY